MQEQLVHWVLKTSAASAVVAAGLAVAPTAKGGAADEIAASGQTAAVQTAAMATAATSGTGTAAADSLAAKKAAAVQKAQSMQKVSAALRSRRVQAQRAVIAYDDVNGHGASSLLSGSSNWRSQFNSGTGSSGAGSAFSGMNGLNGMAGNLYGGTPGSGSNGTASNTNASSGIGTNGATSSSSSDQSSASTLGQKIVQYAQSQLGQTVGDGSSRALVDAALSNAGAKPATQNMYGDVIALNTVQPGDILQFQNAIFVGLNYWMILGTPNHTAIVFMIQGSDVILLHQNVNGIRLVQYSTVNLNDLSSGTITAYRAVAADTSTTDSQANGTTTYGTQNSGTTTSGAQTSGTTTSSTTCGQSTGDGRIR